MTRTYTPASYHRRLQEKWFPHLDQEEVDWSLMPTRTAEERRARRIYDVERAAVELLTRAVRQRDVAHPLLAVWIYRHAENPAYVDPLPHPDTVQPHEWARALREPADIAPDTARSMRDLGYWVREERGEFGARWLELTYPLPGRSDEEEIESEYERVADEAAVRLVHVLQDHRLRGEDGEEIRIPLGVGMSVVTSLAAAIADYHQAMLRVVRAREREFTDLERYRRIRASQD